MGGAVTIAWRVWCFPVTASMNSKDGTSNQWINDYPHPRTPLFQVAAKLFNSSCDPAVRAVVEFMSPCVWNILAVVLFAFLHNMALE